MSVKITTRAISRQRKIQKTVEIINYMISILLCNKTALDKSNIAEWDIVVQNAQTLLKKVGGMQNVSHRYIHE